MFAEKEAQLKSMTEGMDTTCFKTSIWDETLYKVSGLTRPRRGLSVL